MTKSKIAISIGMCLGIALTSLPQARADGNPDEGWTRVDITIPVGEVSVNACNMDEFVTLSGQLSATIGTKVQPDGTTSVKEEDTVFATGVGSISGATYTLSDTTSFQINGLSSLPFSFIGDRLSKLIGDGVPDMYLHYRTKLTLNEDGTVTHDDSSINMVCNP
jgi:hypothetical protein